MTSAAPLVAVRRRAGELVVVIGRHAWIVTAALCAAVAAVGLRGGDLPAQDYRVWLFRTHGFVLWDTTWYGGHADIGYGALFPVVGSVLGTMPAGTVACVASTVLFCRLVGPCESPSAAAVRLWFAAVVVVDLAVGRLPFACGLALGLGLLAAIQARRPRLAFVAAVACSLFSPLAALFALLAVLAWLPTWGVRRSLPALGGLVGILVAALTGDGGVFPFPTYVLVWLLTLVAACLLLFPREQTLMRRGIAVYGLACIALFVLPNPVGANIARLASLVAGPLLVYLIVQVRRPVAPLLAMVLVPLVVWQVLPVSGALASTLHDPSTNASYFTGVAGYLDAHMPTGSRVEIPPTSQHWEAKYVAETVPLARGWDRQVDLERNAMLYHPITAAAYRSWLLENSVAFVALPRGTGFDYGATAEQAVLAAPPPWLIPVYTDHYWNVWLVSGARPIVTGAAHVVAVTPGSFDVMFDRAGSAIAGERWSPYWRIESGQACLRQTQDGMTEIRAPRAGPITVSASVRVDGDSRCPGPA